MQKLFENWRGYLEEVRDRTARTNLSDNWEEARIQSRGGRGGDPTGFLDAAAKAYTRGFGSISRGYASAGRRDAAFQRSLRQGQGESALRQRELEMMKRFLDDSEDIHKMMRSTALVASIFDPTGISGWPELVRATRVVYDAPDVMKAGGWLLALLGVVPVIGKAAKVGKLGKLVNAEQDMGRVVKSTAADLIPALRQKGSAGAALANRIEEAEKFYEIQRKTRAARAAGEGRKAQAVSGVGARVITSAAPEVVKLADFKNILWKHIVDNILISKKAAQSVIAQFPKLKIFNREVYRGMKVDADYIIKNYGDEILSKGPGVHVIEVKQTFKPRSKSGTSSWSLEPGEADVWSQGWGKAKGTGDTPFEITFIGGRNSQGLNISAAAEKVGHTERHMDWAEVAMIGNVDVYKVIIVNTQGLEKGQHLLRGASITKLKSGFYPPGSRKEILDKLKTLPESWQRYLHEVSGPLSSGVGVPFGGLSPALAGNFGNNAGATITPHRTTDAEPAEDTYITVKACMHRNSKVLLLKNEKGWDLPGGHLKQGEDTVDGLKREVYEETGLNIGEVELVNSPTGKKRFFCTAFLSDDVHLSNEHHEYKFFHIDEIKNLDNLNETFRTVILKCLGAEQKTRKISHIKIGLKI
jgi:hypothetical protein